MPLPKLSKEEISDIKSAIGRFIFGVDEDLDSWVFALEEILVGLFDEGIGVVARDEEESIRDRSKVVKEVFFAPSDRSISEELLMLWRKHRSTMLLPKDLKWMIEEWVIYGYLHEGVLITQEGVKISDKMIELFSVFSFFSA